MLKLHKLQEAGTSTTFPIAESLLMAKTMIEQTLARSRTASMSDDEVNLSRQVLPYVFSELPDTNRYIVLNREYDPVGANRTYETQRKNYSNLPELHINLTRLTLYRLANTSTDLRLFNDGNPPWQTRSDMVRYYKKLCELILVINAD